MKIGIINKTIYAQHFKQKYPQQLVIYTYYYYKLLSTTDDTIFDCITFQYYILLLTKIK